MFDDLKIAWRFHQGSVIFVYFAQGKSWTEKVRVSQLYQNIWEVHSVGEGRSRVDRVTICMFTTGGYFVFPPPQCHLMVFGEFDDEFPMAGGLILPGQDRRMGYRKLPVAAEHRAFKGGYFFESL